MLNSVNASIDYWFDEAMAAATDAERKADFAKFDSLTSALIKGTATDVCQPPGETQGVVPGGEPASPSQPTVPGEPAAPTPDPTPAPPDVTIPPPPPTPKCLTRAQMDEVNKLTAARDQLKEKFTGAQKKVHELRSRADAKRAELNELVNNQRLRPLQPGDTIMDPTAYSADTWAQIQKLREEIGDLDSEVDKNDEDVIKIAGEIGDIDKQIKAIRGDCEEGSSTTAPPENTSGDNPLGGLLGHVTIGVGVGGGGHHGHDDDRNRDDRTPKSDTPPHSDDSPPRTEDDGKP